MAGDSIDKMKEEIILSKRMFIAGCFGLPWLWICNSLYFRLRVFKPIVLIDYWPGKSPPSTTTSTETEGSNNNNNNGQEQTMEQQLEQQIQQAELEKWVKRSTRGAVLVMTLFVAWIITFQVNKEDFRGWFVMSPTAADLSGW